MTEPEKVIARALAVEDARNWGYDHGFEPGDTETLAFAHAALEAVKPLLAAELETLRALILQVADELDATQRVIPLSLGTYAQLDKEARRIRREQEPKS